MEKPRLLIASSNDEFPQSIISALQGTMDVQSCHDGKQALSLLRASRPDILLIDLILPQMDGLAVLQAAAAEHISVKVIAALDLQSPYILSALSKLQISYAVMKPCDLQSVLAHLEDIAATLQPASLPLSAEPQSRQSVAAGALLELGMNPKWNGFSCLQIGIPQFSDDMRQTVTKELYTDIGKQVGKNSSLVERNIRSAIQKTWAGGNMAAWRRYFTPAPDGSIPRPSNKAFIARMARILYDESRQQVG